MKQERSFTDTQTGTDITECVKWLSEGEVVAIPTETVYGLAGNALSEEAVLRIYETKDRPRFNPLILHVSSLTEAEKWTMRFSEEAIRLAEAFWPGPLTLLLPKSDSIPELVTAGSKNVAIRIPAHPLTRDLLHELPFPLVAPSANPSGYVSPTTAMHVYQGLKGKIPYILDGGPSEIGVESTIIGWNHEGKAIIHRAGGLAPEQIMEVLGYKAEPSGVTGGLPHTPGQLKSHYAPDSPLFLQEPEENVSQGEEVYLIRFSEPHPSFPKDHQRILSESGSLEEAAKNLFSILRDLDSLQPSCIYAERVPEKGLGFAINDRLERACHVWKKNNPL